MTTIVLTEATTGTGDRYASVAQLKVRLGITDTTDDTPLAMILDAVSRLIDERCGRRFWKEGTAAARYFTAEQGDLLFLNDDLVSISTSGLVTDEDGDRTYERTWATTDYDLEPYNAAADSKPYTQIRTSPQGVYAFPLGRKGVRITGIWGWPVVPAAIVEATLLQSERIFKRKDAIFGVLGSIETGMLTITEMDPDVETSLMPCRRMEVLGV